MKFLVSFLSMQLSYGVLMPQRNLGITLVPDNFDSS